MLTVNDLACADGCAAVRTKKPLEHVQRLVMLFIRKWINIRIVRAKSGYTNDKQSNESIQHSAATIDAEPVSLTI